MPLPTTFAGGSAAAAPVEALFPVSYGGNTFYNHMVWIPQFTHADIAGVTFGGFWAGKYICSQPNAFNGAGGDKPDIADSADPGTCPAVSQPSVPGWRYINYWYARKACANNGVGWHMMTAFEWASLAFFSEMNGTMPHGNNNNTNPPSAVENPAETATVDAAAIARNPTYYANLTGTGPITWNHNHLATGVTDLNGNMWEWSLGLHMRTLDETPAEGMPLVLASLNVGTTTSPYGSATAVALNSLTDSAKAWTTNEFAGMILMDRLGARHAIASNTGSVLALTSGLTPATGVYEILKAVATDITGGCTSGQKIATLRDADADLKAFAIPATTSAGGAAKYGTDGYWFDKADPGSAPNNIRSALRGGAWTYSVLAGVFALYLSYYPSFSIGSVAARCCKSI